MSGRYRLPSTARLSDSNCGEVLKWRRARQELIRKAAPAIEREHLLKQQVAPGHCRLYAINLYNSHHI